MLNNMFKKMAVKNREIEGPSVNLIGSGTVIEGDVSTTGDIRIDGLLKGGIKVKGKLVVGASGSIEGDVDCLNGDISGSIKGKVVVSELLSLKATAKVTGDIFTSKIAIEPGATFTGACNMGGVIKDIKGERTEQNKFAAEKTA
jgi:cytoskeletal protein CcmA (bactofilin family)